MKISQIKTNGKCLIVYLKLVFFKFIVENKSFHFLKEYLSRSMVKRIHNLPTWSVLEALQQILYTSTKITKPF